MNRDIGSAAGYARKRAEQGSGRSQFLEVARLSEQELIEVEVCNPFDTVAGHQRLFREDASLPEQRRHELRLAPISNPAGNDSPANMPWIKARILLVGGPPIVLAGLRSVLGSARSEGFQVVGTVAEHRHALVDMSRYRPDMVLLSATDDLRKDLTMVRTLHRSPDGADLRIVLLRQAANASQVSQMLKAGVSGAFPLDQDATCVVRAIAVVAAGGSIFLPAPLDEDRFPEVQEEPEPSVDQAGLTNRERAVLSMLARGLSNAEIGCELSLSVATVKKHLTQAMRKISQPDRLRAALYAHRQGLA